MHDTAVGGDVVMVSCTMRRIHRAEWAGIPATGRAATLIGVDVLCCAKGRIVEERSHADYLGFLRQLGAIPPA